MPEKEKHRIAVVGAGPAGLAFATSAAGDFIFVIPEDSL